MTRALLSGLVPWIVFAGHTAADDTLDAKVESVVSKSAFARGHWGLMVADARTGEILYARNPDQLFCPASVTKLFSCAAALVELGPDHRFTTPVLRNGTVSADGILDGDLILVAQGDLSLGGRTGPDGHLLFEDNDHSYANDNPDATLVAGDPVAGLDHLAREVQAAGIRRVTGEVLIDDRLFPPAPSTGSGPSRVSPIVVNDNLIDIKVTPAQKPGEPATVLPIPPTSYAAMDIQVATSAAGGSPSIRVESVAPRRILVRGTIPAGHRPILKNYEVPEPADFARSLFIEALRRRGVETNASPLGHNRPDRLPSRQEVSKLEKLGAYTSPPFREYLRVILKVSQNLHASTLPLLVAAAHGESSLQFGLRQQGRVLQALEVELDSASFGGGAGGSRADLVTPRATVTLLRAMTKRPDFSAFEAALPVLGRDGTLARTVSSESPVRGHARAKTGTFWVINELTGKPLLLSKALAGYMETATGRPLVFAFFVNQVPLETEAERVWEASAVAGKLLGTLCEVFYGAEDRPIETRD